LPPGEYNFRVIAANSDGVWNESGAMIRVVVKPPFWRTWWFAAAIICSFAGLGFLIYNRRVAFLKRAHHAQEAFSRRLIESQEQERKRIAAELHDGLGQSLVVIKNRALISLNTPDNHERLLSQVEEISEAASAAIIEARGIAHNLHPYQIEHLGLTTALRTVIKSAAGSSNIEFTAEIDELDGELSKEAEINLYRIVQEAINNIVKHSEATRSGVSLKKNRGIIDLLIEDNGKGFSPDSEKRAFGLGLVGIGERAKMLNAKHEVRSAPEKGTSIHLQMVL
jgi:signal transduction histidine kinase